MACFFSRLRSFSESVIRSALMIRSCSAIYHMQATAPFDRYSPQQYDLPHANQHNHHHDDYGKHEVTPADFGELSRVVTCCDQWIQSQAARRSRAAFLLDGFCCVCEMM